MESKLTEALDRMKQANKWATEAMDLDLATYQMSMMSLASATRHYLRVLAEMEKNDGK